MAALCYAEARGVRRDDARAVELFCRATQVGIRVRTKSARGAAAASSPRPGASGAPHAAAAARPPPAGPPRTVLRARNAEG